MCLGVGLHRGTAESGSLHSAEGGGKGWGLAGKVERGGQGGVEYGEV